VGKDTPPNIRCGYDPKLPGRAPVRRVIWRRTVSAFCVGPPRLTLPRFADLSPIRLKRTELNPSNQMATAQYADSVREALLVSYVRDELPVLGSYPEVGKVTVNSPYS